MKTIKIQIVKILLVILAILLFASYNRSSIALAQPFITNSSFEDFDYPPAYILRADSSSEITRCLGRYESMYPTWAEVILNNRLPFVCMDNKAWYSPTLATADYFNRFSSNPHCKEPTNSFSDYPNNIQHPVGWIDSNDEYREYTGFHNLKCYDSEGIVKVNENGVKQLYVNNYSEYISKKLNSPLEN